MKNIVLASWNFIFNHNKSPLRHIPNEGIRHYVLQLLGLMWALAFSIAIGSYTVFAVSLVGHVVLIGAVAITATTYATATVKPELFVRKAGWGRSSDGEHI